MKKLSSAILLSVVGYILPGVSNQHSDFTFGVKSARSRGVCKIYELCMLGISRSIGSPLNMRNVCFKTLINNT